MRLLALALLIGFLILEALYGAMVRLGDLREQVDRFLGYATVAFLVYLVIVWVVRRSRAPRHPSHPWMLWGIVAAGVVFRLTLFGLPPTLSDDIYRYLWDGRVQAAGINPYRHAPRDAALSSLRTEEWVRINHPDIPTIYPPLMQLAFRIGVGLAPTIWMQKLFFVGCDLTIIVLLIVLLPRWGLSPLASVIYAWHPLVIVEVAGSGHNDPWGILWLLVGLGCWQTRATVKATAAFALAFLSKFATVLLLPFYAMRARKLLVIFAATVAIGGLSCLCSPHFTPGLGHYARHWEFNSSLYSVLLMGLGSPLATRVLCGTMLMIIGLLMAKRSPDLVGYTVGMFQALMLLTPVVEPWYLLWLIPLLCLRFSWIWLVFSGLVMVSYVVLVRFVRDGVWEIPLWVKWVEYSPLYAWLLWRGWQRLADVSHKAVSNQQPAVSSS